MGVGHYRWPTARDPVGVHPAERVRIVTETARAVLDKRLDPEMGAQTLTLQQEQIGDRLRGDRIDVTRFEMQEVATTLRRLGEQISDRASGLSDPSAHRTIAQVLGELAQTLR
jgi:hypothetical protein